MSKKDESRPSLTNIDKKDARAGKALAPLNRHFVEKGQASHVLIELAASVSPASPFTDPSTSILKKLRQISGNNPRPVFAVDTDSRRNLYPATMSPQVDDLQRFVEVPTDSVEGSVELAKIIQRELREDVTEVMPVPFAEPALGPPQAELASPFIPTPDFAKFQSYLGPGPEGINASYAWQFPGGDGAGVTIVDLEGGWRLDHENLTAVRFNLWSGEIKNNDAWLDHGTAVVGLMSGPRDLTGIVGISPGARTGMISVFSKDAPGEQQVAKQIITALSFVKPGDVMLIELQRPGPRTDFKANAEQKGYIPVSFWPDVRAAISKATSAGVCVVEVAGNGGENLDDAIYEGRFDQRKNDSGGIVVAAGAPPGMTFGPPRSRLSFSNYGSRIDCQCWGQLIATSGYGDLWGGKDDVNRAYTARFMGTSGAAPMVASLIACVQGRHRLVYGSGVNPYLMRNVLNNIGWTQTDAPDSPIDQRIGLQPDLGMLFRFFRLVQ